MIVGVDPGLTGAVAFIDGAGGSCRIDDLPTLEKSGSGLIKRKLDGRALLTLFQSRVGPIAAVLCVIEDVGTLGGEKAAQIQGSLQYSKAVIETVAAIAMYPTVLVGVQRWKGFYKLGKDKKDAIRLAKTLYPDAPITLMKHEGRADALLLAHYARRTMT